ncbi:Ger(x)C family spore germination protein [Priestia abyssalis]|uniref:Ger(x)C family spore germination protein n=1 Tax=Priestia abyssalis TaxID=1221450 RepID=UPI000994A285|nr:Ger(x)C family spore germination protein [Priestia abyssalis]
MKHKPFILFFMFLCMGLLSGCWDRAELQDLDIVSAIGIDEGGDDVENRYRVTVQIMNEGQIAGAAGQGGGKAEMAPVTTYSAAGSTVAEALRKIAPKSPQELFFPHVQLMVIGEELARNKGIQDLFDWIERDAQFRTLFPILIVRDNTAKTLLQIATPLEAVPAAKIVGGLEATKKIWGEYASTRADQVIQQLSGEGANLTGIQIIGDPMEGNKLTNVQQISPNTDIEVKGLAIFKKGKLKKWLEGDAARGATWINNEVTKTVMNLDCEKKKKGIAVDLMRSNTKMKAEIKNQKPVIHLTVRSEGHISEVHCPTDLDKHETIEQLEKQMKKEIKEEIRMAVDAAKEQKSDIFRFGETVNREDPKLWKRIKKNWDDEIFPETEVKINVQAFIRRSGLRTKPYIK